MAQSLLVLLIVSCLFSSYANARESQFFNKAPAATNNDVVSLHTKQPETSPQPDFLPDNEPAHGLHGGLLPAPSTHNNKYLPGNYNPVAYVTQSEATNESPARGENINNNNLAENYFITPEEQDPEYRDRRNYVSEAAALGRRENSFPQGMSDTRSVANGRYHYDIEAEKYNSNHPYQSFRRSNPEYEGFNGAQKSMGGYQNQNDEFLNNNWHP